MISFVDVPGHEIRPHHAHAAPAIDVRLLIVAADDGSMPLNPRTPADPQSARHPLPRSPSPARPTAPARTPRRRERTDPRPAGGGCLKPARRSSVRPHRCGRSTPAQPPRRTARSLPARAAGNVPPRRRPRVRPRRRRHRRRRHRPLPTSQVAVGDGLPLAQSGPAARVRNLRAGTTKTDRGQAGQLRPQPRQAGGG